MNMRNLMDAIDPYAALRRSSRAVIDAVPPVRHWSGGEPHDDPFTDYVDSEDSALLRRFLSGKTMHPRYGTADMARFVEAMDGAIDAHPLPHAVTVYRGLHGGWLGPIIRRLLAGKVPPPIRDPSFASTSLSRGVAQEFARSGASGKPAVLMELHVPAGHPALAVHAVEAELLLPRGSRFQLTAGRSEGDLVLATGEVLPYDGRRGSFTGGDGTPYRFVSLPEASVTVPAADAGRPGRPSPLANPAFRRWFGRSKIVDRNGEPLVVYHGTASAFEAFEVASIGKVFGADTQGFFFTNNTGSDMASGYATRAARGAGTAGANIIPAYVKIEHPYTFADYAYAYECGDGTKPAVIDKIIDGRSLIGWFDEHNGAVIAGALDGGHDGVFLYDPQTDLGDGVPENLVVAFRPEQIKSIFARAFDPHSANLSEAGLTATPTRTGCGPQDR